MMRRALLVLLPAVALLNSCTDLPSDPAMPAGSSKHLLRVIEILPNPVGSDDSREEVTLRNFDTVAISVSNWKLSESGGDDFPFGASAGSIAPGELKTITHNGSAVLNNAGETLQLLDEGGEAIQTISYTAAAEGQVFKY